MSRSSDINGENCPMCNMNTTETIHHFLFNCQKYKIRRDDFNSEMEKCISNYERLPNSKKIKLILDLNFEDHERHLINIQKTINLIISYIKCICTIRMNTPSDQRV